MNEDNFSLGFPYNRDEIEYWARITQTMLIRLTFEQIDNEIMGDIAVDAAKEIINKRAN